MPTQHGSIGYSYVTLNKQRHTYSIPCHLRHDDRLLVLLVMESNFANISAEQEEQLTSRRSSRTSWIPSRAAAGNSSNNIKVAATFLLYLTSYGRLQPGP